MKREQTGEDPYQRLVKDFFKTQLLHCFKKRRRRRRIHFKVQKLSFCLFFFSFFLENNTQFYEGQDEKQEWYDFLRRLEEVVKRKVREVRNTFYNFILFLSCLQAFY